MTDLLIITYFALLFFISFYGVYLYWLVVNYLRLPGQTPLVPMEPEDATNLPMVTVQLPIFNEKRVVARLIEAVTHFEWPQEKLEIQVLDDSTDETSEIVARLVTELSGRGVTIEHIRRPHRAGYKAGALAVGQEKARGEFIAIFDADNIPPSDFLRRMIPYFDDPRVGMAQARWSFLNRDDSLLCQAQALFLDSHFYIEQAARSRAGLFLNFNGTAGIWRRRAIDSAGGWQSDTLTEDLDLSYRAQLLGWKMLFVEDVDVPTELPNSVRAFKTQQHRWARGAMETGFKLLGRVRRAKLPLAVKIAAHFHLTQKVVSVALLLLSILLIPALYFRWEASAYKVLLIDLPVFITGMGAMSVFYGIAYRREKKNHSARARLVLPMLSAIGLGLAANNSLAVISALKRRESEFVRTPKTGSARGRKLGIPHEYRVSFDRTLLVEALLLANGSIAFIYAFDLGLYFSLPFLATFVFGYGYFVVNSLRERYG